MQELFTETGKAKVAGIKEYVQGLCQAGAKFLVFAYHVAVLEAIRSAVVVEKVWSGGHRPAWLPLIFPSRLTTF